jgi:hypothetical protein
MLVLNPMAVPVVVCRSLCLVNIEVLILFWAGAHLSDLDAESFYSVESDYRSGDDDFNDDSDSDSDEPSDEDAMELDNHTFHSDRFEIAVCGSPPT